MTFSPLKGIDVAVIPGYCSSFVSCHECMLEVEGEGEGGVWQSCFTAVY